MRYIKLFTVLAMLFYPCLMFGNAIWAPMLSVFMTRVAAFPLVFVSLIVEALTLYIMMKGTISFIKAVWMSCVGNIISMILGGLLLSLVVLLELAIGVEISWVYTLFDFTIAWFLSVAIELQALHLIFKYPKEKLLYPVLIGNSITYGLTAIVFAIQDIFNNREILMPLYNVTDFIFYPIYKLFR